VNCSYRIKNNYIFGNPDPGLPIFHNFCGAMMMIEASLLLSIPVVKQFSVKNFPSPVKTGAKFGVFLAKWGLNLKITPKKPPSSTK